MNVFAITLLHGAFLQKLGTRRVALRPLLDALGLAVKKLVLTLVVACHSVPRLSMRLRCRMGRWRCRWRIGCTSLVVGLLGPRCRALTFDHCRAHVEHVLLVRGRRQGMHGLERNVAA